MTMQIKGWRKFQHYKHRNPPWIKLHRELLNDRQWFDLDDSARSLLVNLWLLAAENDGELASAADIAFRLRKTEKEIKSTLSKLSDWLEDDDASDMLAGCKQYASNLHQKYPTESEDREQRTEHEASPHEISGTFDEGETFGKVVPIDEAPRARLYRLGKPILISLGVSERSAGLVIGRWLKTKNDPTGILAALEYAAANAVAEPISYVTACLSSKDSKREKSSLAETARQLAEQARELEGIGRPIKVIGSD